MKRRRWTYYSVWACALVVFVACKKEVPEIEMPEPTKYEIISGDYNVYDTVGNFLYEMNLYYLDGPEIEGFKRDSIYFTNFDGSFSFSEIQTSGSSHYVKIGSQDTLFDANGERWKILIAADSIFNNTFKNDTIRMIFHKTNINYWIEDAVPFYECYCKQIAVKQY